MTYNDAVDEIKAALGETEAVKCLDFSRWHFVEQNDFPNDKEIVVVRFYYPLLPILAKWREGDNGGAFYDVDEGKPICVHGVMVEAWKRYDV